MSAIKQMCLRIKKERGVQPQDVAIPVETDPGEVPKVDFGFAGKLYDPARGILRKAWFFVMVLGFSRHQFARIVFDQRAETWLQLHVEAFETFGGVVRTVVLDNLKAAVIRASFGQSDWLDLNRSYRELARHYGVQIDPTPPRAPEKKGKSESAVKYVKGDFLRPRDFDDIDDANAQLDTWVVEIAGKRIHGTTAKRPLEVFVEQERSTLRPLPAQRFEPVVWKQVKVHRDGRFQFERRIYLVP